jgi:hypothetical protein
MANDETCAFCGRSGVKMSDEHVVVHSLKYLASPGVYLRHHTAYIYSETGEGQHA